MHPLRHPMQRKQPQAPSQPPEKSPQKEAVGGGWRYFESLASASSSFDRCDLVKPEGK
jgi:hypothetical protein